MRRRAQFFIIGTVLLAGVLFLMANLLQSSAEVNYDTVVKRHDTAYLRNAHDRAMEAWWDRDWNHRLDVIVEERGGDARPNATVHVVVPAPPDAVQADCDDIRVRQDDTLRPWRNTTACRVGTYDHPALALAQYPMDAGTGQTVADGTGHGFDGVRGTSDAEEAADPSWGTGRYAAGLRFDGSNDAVTVPDQPLLDGMDALTLTAWIKPDRVIDDTARAVVRKTGAYLLQKTDSNDLCFAVWDGGSRQDWEQACIASTTLDADRWQHVAARFNGSHYHLFHNGEQVSVFDTGATGVDTSGDPLGIGAEPDSATFDGRIDDVRIYNRSLPANVIEGVYRNGVGVNASINLQPLDRTRFAVYTGNPFANATGYGDGWFQRYGSPAPRLSVGERRTETETRRRLDRELAAFNDRIGPSLQFIPQLGCDRIQLQSPRLGLTRLAC